MHEPHEPLDSPERPAPGSESRRDFLRLSATMLAGAALASVAAPGASPGTATAATQDTTLQAEKLAWAGVRLRLGKDTLYLDPLLDPDAWGPALRDELVPMAPGDGLRYLLITHRHPDHFDKMAARQALGDTGTVVCTQDATAAVAAAGFKVRQAVLYEPNVLGEFTATAVPAVDGYGDPQVSWVVSGGGRRIIHCGDTLWHGSWWQIGRQFGPFDAAFLPINGARFGWRKPASDVPAVLTPEQAVAAAVVLGARVTVPIHYGVSGADGYAEIPDAEAQFVAAAARRKVDVQVLRSGQAVTWRPRADRE